MKKTKLFAMATIVLAMGLVACNGGNKSSQEPSKEPTQSSEPASAQQSSAAASSAAASSAAASSAAASSAAASSSAAQQDAEMAVSAIDVITESNKVYLKITGTISGFANADAMKMAFGLLDADPAQGTTAEWLFGSETPADADYKLVPTVNNGTFELKVDVSIVTTVKAGMFSIYVGPKGAYAAVSSQGVTMGSGKGIFGGYRWYIRGDKGALAMDELPPLALTESFVKVEGEGEAAAVYHYIGGALNTTKLPEAEFLAKHPYVQYEACVNWAKNVLGSSEKTDLVTTVVENGKAYIKTNITSLPNETYNIKFNLNADQDADIKMDEIIDKRDESDQVIFNGHAYAVYADSTKTEKADIYGNCGLYISHAHTWTRGEQVADSELYQLTCPEASHVGYELDLNSTNTSGLGSDKKMNSKKVSNFNITGITEGEYAVYFKAHVSTGNDSATSTVGLSCGDQLDDNGNQAGGNAVPGRYSMQAGNGDTEYTVTGNKNFNKIGMDASNFKWTNCAVIKSLMIKGDAGTLKLSHTGAGYSLYIESVRLVKVGNYIKPAYKIELTDNKMKIEAEDYHVLANNRSGTVTDDETASGGKYVAGLTYNKPFWGDPTIGQLDYYVSAAEALSLKISVHAKSDKADATAAFEVWVDGAKVTELSYANAYADVATDAVNFALGKHIISFKGINGVKADLDYFELVKPAA